MKNTFIKLICSIPIILVVTYFSKILGILLIILRLIVIKNNRYILPSTLIVTGLIILIPKGINMISSDIPYINDIISSDIYPKLLEYSKFLIIFGVILFIISYFIQLLSNKIGNTISSYINQQVSNDYKIKEENDYKMRLKQEEAKYTRVVKCPHCGANNTIKEKTGICSHCRTPLE